MKKQNFCFDFYDTRNVYGGAYPREVKKTDKGMMDFWGIICSFKKRVHGKKGMIIKYRIYNDSHGWRGRKKRKIKRESLKKMVQPQQFWDVMESIS